MVAEADGPIATESKEDRCRIQSSTSKVIGEDGARLQKLYRDAFDWTVNADNPMAYGLVEAQGDGIGGGVGATMGTAPYVTVYIQVDDMPSALDRIEALGGETVMDITTLPGMVILAQFRDPEGNLIGLVHSQTPPAE